MSGYLRFVLEHRGFLGFGFVLCFCSSFGQTFFVSLFGADLRGAFELSHGGFGLVYSLATLGSAATLVWAGRQIDVLDLRVYATLVCAGLAGAAFLLASAGSAVVLGLALYGLRLSGQGLMTHTAVTSMARYFAERRGTAMSLARLGLPLGEVLLPVPIVAVVAAEGWRATWVGLGVGVLAVGAPLVLWLLRGHGERHRAHVARLTAGSDDAPARDGAAAAPVVGWSRGHVLRDARFYLLQPGALAPACVCTGVFFHQAHVSELKGWPETLMAGSFAGFATGGVVGSLVAGVLVDRLAARRLLWLYLWPLAGAVGLLAASGAPLAAPLFMIGAGLSAGAGATIMSALWAEVYGTTHLGAIRSLATALAVLSSAASPVALGWLFDAGLALELVLGGCVAYVAAGALLLAAVAPRLRARPA